MFGRQMNTFQDYEKAKELARKRELYFDEPIKRHQAYERMSDIGFYEPGRYLDRMTRNKDYQSQEERSQSVNNFDNKNNQFYNLDSKI
jgi:hypothetical protein